MKVVPKLIIGAVVLLGLVIPENLTAQTLTFEQDWFTDNWTENDINWNISGGDIRGYVAHGGDMHWSVWGAFTDNLTASACINTSGLWLYIDNLNESMSDFSIKGYDVNNNLIGTEDITISEYNGSYGWVTLNWNYITKIQVVWQDEEAQGSAFIDDLSYSTNPPAITFTNGADAALAFSQTAPFPPQDNWPFGQFSLTGATTSSRLSSVTITLGGSYSGLNGTNPFRLYAANTNDFSSAAAIGSDAAATGASVTFSALDDALPSGTRYYWITADLSSSASGTINGTIGASGAMIYTSESGENSSSSSYGVLNTSGDQSLPVGLSSFSARMAGQLVYLKWVTESEIDNLGFTIERSGENGVWLQIASYKTDDALRGQGNTTRRTEYNFIDHNVIPGEEYSYRLSDVSAAGVVSVCDSLTIKAGHLPETTAIENAYPNPFNPQTCITYHLAKPADVNISVFDLRGRLVRILHTGRQPAGSYHVLWDGTDGTGNRITCGIYFIMMETEKTRQVQKVIMIK